MRTTISEQSLREFYEKFVLLQFGLADKAVVWDYSAILGPDEDAHYFHRDGHAYVLIFEDYGGLAVDRGYIKENVDLQGKSFSYIEPTSATEHSPSWLMKFDTPYQYCHNVTGAFTLIKLSQ